MLHDGRRGFHGPFGSGGPREQVSLTSIGHLLMVPMNHAHPTRRVARARHRPHPPAGAGDVRPRRAGAPGLRRGPRRRRPPAGLRGHPPRPVHRREGEGDRPALPRVPRAAAARRRPPPPRLQHDQDQPRARARGRLRRERRPPAPPPEQPPPARPHPRADRGDGQPRDPDAPRLDRGLRAPGPRAGEGRHPGGARRRRAPRQAQRRPPRGAPRADDPARDDGAARHHRAALRARGRPGAQRVHGDALHVHGRVRQAPRGGDLPDPLRRRAQRLPQPDGGGDRAVARPAQVHLLERRARPAGDRPPDRSPS